MDYHSIHGHDISSFDLTSTRKSFVLHVPIPFDKGHCELLISLQTAYQPYRRHKLWRTSVLILGDSSQLVSVRLTRPSPVCRMVTRTTSRASEVSREAKWPKSGALRVPARLHWGKYTVRWREEYSAGIASGSNTFQ